MTTFGPPFCVIQPGKQKSRDIAEAICDGFGGGEIGVMTAAAYIPEDHTPVYIGVHPSTIESLLEVRRLKRRFVTVDNGYFKPYKEGGYYRATTNALQWIETRRLSGVGRFSSTAMLEQGAERYAALQLPALRPWREYDNDGPLLVIRQTDDWFRMMGLDPVAWVNSVVARAKAYGPREIIVRHKPLKRAAPQPALEDELARAYGVVGLSSAALLKAAMHGVPIATLGYSASSPLGVSTVDGLLLSPKTPERESILHALAANQWTLDEMCSGMMWSELQARFDPEFLMLS